MKRKSVGIAVVLAALAVLVNVFALKSATVNNDLSLKITNTTTSLIAIDGVGADSDVTFSSGAGYASITLPTGANGLQPNSSYTFYPVFNVKNNSGVSRDITLSDTTSPAPAGVTLTFVDTNGNAIAPGTTVTTGSTLPVGIKIDLTTSAVIGTTPLTIAVDAQ
ncbi:MAG TPA: hypothetical protein VK191_17545 [Symbiobacteriaceae bacterium]|nr:hypothetical protein [Symbiobacteriaceae bacterium]